MARRGSNTNQQTYGYEFFRTCAVSRNGQPFSDTCLLEQRIAGGSFRTRDCQAPITESELSNKLTYIREFNLGQSSTSAPKLLSK